MNFDYRDLKDLKPSVKHFNFPAAILILKNCVEHQTFSEIKKVLAKSAESAKKERKYPI